MRSSHKRDSDDLLEILKAYRLPTLIMSVGLIAAIISFQLSLKYEIRQSEQSFKEVAGPIFNQIELKIKSHEQIVRSMGNLLGQIRNLQEEEFSNIVALFTDATDFQDFYLYRYNDGDGLIKLSRDTVTTEGGSITELFTSADTQENIQGIGALPETRNAIEKAKALNKTYVSNPYEIQYGNKAENYTVIVAPLSTGSAPNLFVVGAFPLDGFFNSVFEDEGADVNIRVYNQYGEDRNLIYERLEEQQQSLEFIAAMDKESRSLFALRRTLLYDDHQWDVMMFSSVKSLMN